MNTSNTQTRGESYHPETILLKERINPALSKMPPVVCSRCRDIDFNIILGLDGFILREGRKEGYLIANLGSLTDTAVRLSCDLCSLFHTIRVPSMSPEDEYHLRAFPSIHATVESFQLPARVISRDLARLAVVPANAYTSYSTIEKTGFFYCHSISDKGDTYYTPRIISPGVDYNQIKSWLAFCKQYHKVLCKSVSSAVRGMKLIDCYDSCLTTCVVDAPTGCSYIALSYVWGPPKFQNPGQGLASTPTNIEHASTWPRVIIEAILVVKEMGYRYLWADQQCIDQSNKNVQKEQIDQMDLIYGGADLTIVAAAGEDSSYGLPGVGNTPRALQPSLELDGIQLISYLNQPQYLIKDSKWATRAWTHQEAILSQRLLFFTEFETYFECHSMQCREGLKAKLNALHCKQGRIYSGLNDSFFLGRNSCALSPTRSPFHCLNTYYEHIHQYSARDLSHAKDSLRAFTGIMNHLKKRKISIEKRDDTSILQLSGIPFLGNQEQEVEALKSFSASLLWVHQEKSWRKLGTISRRNFLPSWTWAGWDSQVDFLIRTFYEYSYFTSRLSTIPSETKEGTTNTDSFQSNTASTDRSDSVRPILIMAKILCSKTFALRFTDRLGQCRIISTIGESSDTVALPLRAVCPSHRGRKQQQVNVRSSGGFKAQLYLSKRPNSQVQFIEYLRSGHWLLVLVGSATVPRDRKKQPGIYFLIAEPSGDSFSRVGVLVIRKDFATCRDNLVFEERAINLL